MKENTVEIILLEDNPVDVEMELDALQERNLANKVHVLKDGTATLSYIMSNVDCRPGGLTNSARKYCSSISSFRR